MTFPRDPNQDGNRRTLPDPAAPTVAPSSFGEEEPDRRLPIAEAFIRARFFPPLPADAYGQALLDAVDHVADCEPDALVDLPPGTEPLPRGYHENPRGTGYCVAAGVLFDALHAYRFLDWLEP